LAPAIATFTDFGAHGPYLGQMELAIRAESPDVAVVHVLADAPVFDPRAAAYLLAALAAASPPATVWLAVVDPGVGTDRRPMAARVDGRWFVGPDNGLLELVTRRGGAVEVFEIVWRPARLSSTFHGRDLFAPIAARLAAGAPPAAAGLSPMAVPARPDWPDDLARVIHLDHYGNAWTGLRAAAVTGTTLGVGGHRLAHARTFGEAAPGQAFWYENSSGLVEIAVNGGRADELAGVTLGAIVTI